ncbi:MAG: MBL fold metallo-hydrolase [Cyanobacteria bacterium P01_D01_bin.156]
MTVSAYMLGNETIQKSPPCLAVKFWGVRGSVPTPGPATASYGGNTVCVEIVADQQRLIFDAGTGLRSLGEMLSQDAQPIEGHLFFTHTQWDRIQGFPFFLPAFEPGNQFHIYGGTAANGASIKQRLSTQMLQPGFTVPLQKMQAKLMFHEIIPGETIRLGNVEIEPISLSGSNSALGYCIRCADKCVVYATDTNHEQLDESLVFYAQEADLLIYDGTYIDMCDQIKISSSAPPWQAAIELAQTAQVKQLAMVHYGPRQTDEVLEVLATKLQDLEPTVSLAREGMTIALS